MIRGITRNVFLTKNFAIKLPTFRSWSLFLTGLLANMQEALWWTTKDSRLCPVVFSCSGGWFIVMKRAEPLDDDCEINYDHFVGLPLDPKITNFGKIDGRVVLIDYGS